MVAAPKESVVHFSQAYVIARHAQKHFETLETRRNISHWQEVFGPNWKSEVKNGLFNLGYHNDVLRFSDKPKTHTYPSVSGANTTETSGAVYFAEQFGGLDGEDKIHVSGIRSGSHSSRHIHEHQGGSETYFVVDGGIVLLEGDGDQPAEVKLSKGQQYLVHPNTWHQVRNVSEKPALLIVINHNAKGVPDKDLHRLHDDQLHNWSPQAA